MSENKMTEVAKLLGVELDTDFEIVEYPNETFQLRSVGLFQLRRRNNSYSHVGYDDRFLRALEKLLCGEWHIKKKPWKATSGVEYFIPDPSFPLNARSAYANADSTATNEFHYSHGLMCKTQEKAVEVAKAMIKVAREMQGIDKNE